MNKTSLLDIVIAMKTRKPITVWYGLKQHTGIVNGIQAEDGSGRSWNITLLKGIRTTTVYFRES